MADSPGGSSKEPNLELPSFGFGRKRKQKRREPDSGDAVEETPQETTQLEPVEAPAPAPTPEPTPVATAPEPEPAPEPAAGPAPEPARRAPRRRLFGRSDRASGTAAKDTPDTVDDMDTVRHHEPTLASDHDVAPAEETATLPPVTGEPSAQEATALPPTPQEHDHRAPEQEEPREPRQRRSFTLPHVPPDLAAVLAGIVTGLVGVGLTYVALTGCEAVRGVGNCGGLGLFALLIVLAVQVIIGAILLRAWGLGEPASTSLLGVALVAVLAMLFFLSSIDSVWMLLVIPTLTAITFVISSRVTSNFVEDPEAS